MAKPTSETGSADPRAGAQGLRDRIAKNGRQIEACKAGHEAAARESVTATGEPKRKAARSKAQKIAAEITDLQTEAGGLKSLLTDAEEAIREHEAKAAEVDVQDHQARVNWAIDAALSAIERAHGFFPEAATAADAAIGSIEYCGHVDRFYAGVLTEQLKDRLSISHLQATCQAQTTFAFELPAASLNPVRRNPEGGSGVVYSSVLQDARQVGDKAVDAAVSAGVELALAIGKARTCIRAVSEVEPGFDAGPLTAKLTAGLKWDVLQAAGFKRRMLSTMPDLDCTFTLCSAIPKGQAESEIEAARKDVAEAERALAAASRRVRETEARLKQLPTLA